MSRRLSLVFLCASLASCTCGGGGAPDGSVPTDGGMEVVDSGTPTGRCEIDLAPWVEESGNAQLVKIDNASQLIAGPNAHGNVGDYLLSNDRIRVIVQGPIRAFGPQPFGGNIIDADLVDAPAGDQFGEIGLLYNFGRTVNPTQFDVIRDGSVGGAVVLAASGDDTANDYLSIRNQLQGALGRVPYADPYVPQPLRITTYFVLNPGEQRLQQVTAFCNTDRRLFAGLAVGDLVDPGYVLELFNPRSCTNGYGFGGLCFGLDRLPWFGYQGSNIAYGYAPYKAGSPLVPEGQNAALSVAGITGVIIGSNGILGLGEWVKESTTTPRPGEIRIPPQGYSVVARDFWVAKNIGEISNLIETSRASAGALLGEFSGTVTQGGQPVANARIAFEGTDNRAAFVTDTNGTFSGTLPRATYRVSAWKQGRNPTAKQQVTLSTNPSTLTFSLDAPRVLTVNVREANGGPMPAKVSIFCASGTCPVPHKSLVLFTDTPKDPMPDDLALIGYVGASGTQTFELPAGQYTVLVSRGPEYSIHPNDFPTSPGELVDLRTADTSINAVLARVIDTTGWVSADLHVHAVNSPDSIVDNGKRALTFAADGVDVLVGTDHDYVTDYAPVILQTGLSPFLSSVVGEEVSPMEWGHYNLFPLPPDANNKVNGGALDWAGGLGPTLTVGQIFLQGRAMGAKTVQVNHARGLLGGFTALKIDTDTFATHADPALFRMEPQVGATPTDSKLISTDFDAFEILNPGDDEYDATSILARAKFNDWFTLLSRGKLAAGTGVSDTHYGNLATGWRTWVQTGSDEPADFSDVTFSARLNEMKAVTSNAPFVTVTAYRVNSAGTQVTPSVGIGGTVVADSQDLGVTVDVQVPAYLDVTRVELYMHRAADDSTCPIDPQSPRAQTTRVSCNGITNSNWPASSIVATQNVILTAGDLETAVTEGPVNYRRYRKRVNFRLAAPTTDNWVVAMVYGSRSLTPLLIPYGGGVANPFAFTNPVLIDSDGNGYDHPPFMR
ncbi:MAG: carboxypeptidase regulatory-like domain-containing protein [Archangium sp.]